MGCVFHDISIVIRPVTADAVRALRRFLNIARDTFNASLIFDAVQSSDFKCSSIAACALIGGTGTDLHAVPQVAK